MDAKINETLMAINGEPPLIPVNYPLIVPWYSPLKNHERDLRFTNYDCKSTQNKTDTQNKFAYIEKKL